MRGGCEERQQLYRERTAGERADVLSSGFHKRGWRNRFAVPPARGTLRLLRWSRERSECDPRNEKVALVDRQPSIDEFLIPDVAGTSHHLIELACEMKSIHSARHLPFSPQLTTVFERASDSEISRPDCLLVVFAVILGVEAIMGRSARITRMDRRPASRGRRFLRASRGPARAIFRRLFPNTVKQTF